MLSRGGRYLEMGNINPRHTYKADPSLLVGFNRSIHGVSLYPPYTLKRALDFLLRTKDRYPYDLLYGKTFPLEEITHAFEEADAFSQTPKGIGRLGIVP
jgi:D-arabinose 1-dehydrogenase-like Zn-dependent alcohol dehydrogenase